MFDDSVGGMTYVYGSMLLLEGCWTTWVNGRVGVLTLVVMDLASMKAVCPMFLSDLGEAWLF